MPTGLDVDADGESQVIALLIVVVFVLALTAVVYSNLTLFGPRRTARINRRREMTEADRVDAAWRDSTLDDWEDLRHDPS